MNNIKSRLAAYIEHIILQENNMKIPYSVPLSSRWFKLPLFMMLATVLSVAVILGCSSDKGKSKCSQAKPSEEPAPSPIPIEKGSELVEIYGSSVNYYRAVFKLSGEAMGSKPGYEVIEIHRGEVDRRTKFTEKP
jgi:hypothetical protein